MDGDPELPVVLTIAGSDSGGGAGIQADLKVFAALGVFGTSAVTAVTAQNPRRASKIFSVPSDLVGAQIRAVFDAFDVRAIKCGMLGTAANVRAVRDALRARRQSPSARFQVPRLVVDPILRATSGATLLEPKARAVLERELLPLATLVTPNLGEARAFLGRAMPMRDAAEALAQRWGCAVYLKGGHGIDPRRATDVFCDGRTAVELTETRVPGRKIHGLGCATSAAIAAFSAQGHSLLDSMVMAKAFMTQAIRLARRAGNHWVLRM